MFQCPSNTPNSQPGSLAGLNPRSCTRCRKRRVRCNRRSPCDNCIKAQIGCSFPPSGRNPLASSEDPVINQTNEHTTRLLSRLNKLEILVNELRENPEATPNISSTISSSRTTVDSSRLSEDTGNLDVDDSGKGRYSSSKLWDNLCDEVGSIRDMVDDNLFIESKTESPNPIPLDVNRAFVFGPVSDIHMLRSLHAPPSQISKYWNIFIERVDPLVKVLHKPTITTILSTIRSDFLNIDPPMEGLLFAIYFSVVTSMEPEDVLLNFSEDKQSLLSRYRYGVEQALSRAEFLTSQDLRTLQTFTIYLVAIRRHDNTRFAWTLTSLAIRMAHSMGVHRDGKRFGLNPFDTEMRRRLWWQIRILDARASEDYGSGLSSSTNAADAELPYNINDDDISFDASNEPAARQGFTDLSLCLVRYEIFKTGLTLQRIPAAEDSTLEQVQIAAANEIIIQDCETRLSSQYRGRGEAKDPLSRIAATIGDLSLSKMWFYHYRTLKKATKGLLITERQREHWFQESVKILELCAILESDPSFKSWSWLFETYRNVRLVLELHAFVHIINEICLDPSRCQHDRAWNAVNASFDDWLQRIDSQRRLTLWLPIWNLMNKARAIRGEKTVPEMSTGVVGSGSVPMPPAAVCLPQQPFPHDLVTSEADAEDTRHCHIDDSQYHASARSTLEQNSRDASFLLNTHNVNFGLLDNEMLHNEFSGEEWQSEEMVGAEWQSFWSQDFSR
ncbi:hypothetical protein V502_06152 [Pseudogymnoascus sp. VKM F-4520 (FW-2644)]|nr:hypothetical protein V502_06152 [Pseudogymnoascus sp. VKM F-4520 (FW-2644)]